MSANLDAPALVGGQSNPETTVNDAIGRLDAAFTEDLTVDLSSDVTLTTTQFRTAMFFKLTPVGSGKKLTIPAVQRLFYVSNSGANDAIVKKGSTELTVPVGAGAFFYTDGGTNSLVALTDSGGSSTQPHDLHVFIPGLPAANVTVFRFVATIAFDLASALAGSYCDAEAAATSTATFTLKKNGSSIGTIQWAAAATTATFTFASPVSFAAGDVFTITSPGTQDATLANVSLNLAGTR